MENKETARADWDVQYDVFGLSLSGPTQFKRSREISRRLQQHVSCKSDGDNNSNELKDDENDIALERSLAAIELGREAFRQRDWTEADELLREASETLSQLSIEKQPFWDVLELKYMLAICTYHTQEPAVTEKALQELAESFRNLSEHYDRMGEVQYLLSLTYIRLIQIGCAERECDKALRNRRRAFGKEHDEYLVALALMGYIQSLLNNRARAKSYIAMIPESRRSAAQKNVEDCLGRLIVHSNPSSPLTEVASWGTGSNTDDRTSSFGSPSATTSGHRYLPRDEEKNTDTMTSRSYASMPSSSVSQNQAELEGRQPARRISRLGPDAKNALATPVRSVPRPSITAGLEACNIGMLHDRPDSHVVSHTTKSLSRTEVLERVRCMPRDDLEDSVCQGDLSKFTRIISMKKGFFWSKLRKRGRAERVTALHFAALFGEVEMARRLIDVSFNVNEIPYGYSTSLSPLTFAIGARQVNMVDLLLENGARPTEPETWSTLAGQLMNRAWLHKTMSLAEKEFVPVRITSILRALLEHGLDVSKPLDKSGKTLLHQAAAFHTGSSNWDSSMRTIVASFLVREERADPFQADDEGLTPFKLASEAGHMEVLQIFGQETRKAWTRRPVTIVELPS